MKKKITKEHIINTKNLINQYIETLLDEKQIDDILSEIVNLINEDDFMLFDNKEIPKNQYYIFDLINKYHTAYIKSKQKYKKDRKNTLESLGIGTLNRKKRFNENLETIEDEDIDGIEKINPSFENLLLDLILNGKQKSGYLTLTFTFIFKDHILHSNSQFFMFDKQYLKFLNRLEETFKFFSFTYLTPQKIVTSIGILIYKYLTTYTKLDDEQKIKFIKYILNFYFKEDAHTQLRPNYFKSREVYCAGIYDNLPIFQWSTSTINDSYYTEEHIKDIQGFMSTIKKDASKLDTFLFDINTAKLSKEEKEKIDNTDSQLIKKLINDLPILFLHNQQLNFFYKHKEHFHISLINRLISPISRIITVFIAFYRKFITK